VPGQCLTGNPNLLIFNPRQLHLLDAGPSHASALVRHGAVLGLKQPFPTLGERGTKEEADITLIGNASFIHPVAVSSEAGTSLAIGH
jgi:hypothetical protein